MRAERLRNGTQSPLALGARGRRLPLDSHMIRLGYAAAVVTTLSLWGARAEADCMCLGPDVLFEAADAVESPDPLAEGELDASGALSHGPRPVTTRAAPTDARGQAPVLWCFSSDDPRCKTDPAGELPLQQTLRIGIALLPTATFALPRMSSTSAKFARASVGAPSQGVSSRLDRPPRV
jgi:hypothetical protein